MFMTQLKGMMNMPFLYPQYISEVLHSFPSETFFLEMYTKEIEQWIEQTLCITNMYYEWPRAVHIEKSPPNERRWGFLCFLSLP